MENKGVFLSIIFCAVLGIITEHTALIENMRAVYMVCAIEILAFITGVLYDTHN